MLPDQTVHYKFERIEKKFRMSADTYRELLPTLNRHMKRDTYGVTKVCNVYCDTQDYALIRRSIERPLYKEKLRLRSYGIPEEETAVFLEIKKKLNGIGYKRRLSLPLCDAKRLLAGEKVESENPQIESELLEFIGRYHPEPRVYLTYDRYAMTCPDDPGLRVTIDRNLMYRAENPLDLTEAGMRPILDDPTEVILEIKTFGAIPEWLLAVMNRLHIYQAPFSKIGTCYTKHIASRPVTTRKEQ